ncbi:DUF5813 family protein [Halomarina litorea]|uniref:DUF5813 family protein n=1 Tax=Halomarina litorea TaxID=2961595 RepID=UPI0020C4014C|nr:DUF5813 family protein [Halomarina sp. BCD28]
MTDEVPDAARRAFEAHDAFSEDADDGAYRLETTDFDGRVTAAESDTEWALRYTVTVRAPTLDAAVEEDVGPNLQEGWLDTLELRSADAPGAVRERVTLDDHAVRTEGEEVVVEYVFTMGDADRAPAVAKAMAEYVEGTYMEGVVPGFTYRPPVADLLDEATQGDGKEGGGPMPL